VIPGSAREALIAEAIGELSLVLDRLDGLVPQLTVLQQELTDSGQRLTAQLADFEAQVMAITQTARTRLVNHVVGRTEDAARRARQENTKAFADAARKVLRQELDGVVRHENWRQARSGTGPQVTAWLTHAGAALAASVMTWAVLALG
jgi:hypothetical protein